VWIFVEAAGRIVVLGYRLGVGGKYPMRIGYVLVRYLGGDGREEVRR